MGVIRSDYSSVLSRMLRRTATPLTPKWDDLRVSMARGTTGASNPTLTAFVGNTQLYAFSATIMQQLFFDVQLPHTWLGASDQTRAEIKPHIHWSPGNSTDTGVVRWGFEWTWANAVNPPGNTFPATQIRYVEQAATGTPYSHQIAEFLDAGVGLDGTGKRLSSILVCRVFRDATNSNDTFTGTAFGLSFDMHIQVGQGGSTQEYSTQD